jgi:hypothetical protein
VEFGSRIGKAIPNALLLSILAGHCGCLDTCQCGGAVVVVFEDDVFVAIVWGSLFSVRDYTSTKFLIY